MRVLLLLVLTGWLTACGEPPQEALRLGTVVWPGYEPLYLARDTGQLDGQAIKLIEYEDLADVRRGLQAGLLDAAAVTLEELLRLDQTGGQFVIVLVLDISSGGDAILARPPIESLSDLRGRNVGVELTGPENYLFARAIELNGLNWSDFNVINLRLGQQAAAYENGDVDAVVNFEPYSTLVRVLGARDIFTSRDIPNEIVDVLVIRRALLETHGEQLAHLTSTWFRAVEQVKANPQSAYLQMSRRLRLDPPAVEKSFGGLRIPPAEEVQQLLLGTPPGLMAPLESVQRTMVDAGMLDGEFDLPSLFPAALPLPAPTDR